MLLNSKRRRITQHKRFVPYSTHPNSAFGGTSFMLKTLGEILLERSYIRHIEYLA
jgi:hypothetical protein